MQGRCTEIGKMWTETHGDWKGDRRLLVKMHGSAGYGRDMGLKSAGDGLEIDWISAGYGRDRLEIGLRSAGDRRDMGSRSA
eukprot:5740659-Pleurochrysis_carterae.AAC.1